MGFLEFGAEFVEGVAVLITTDCVDVFKFGNVQRVSVTVINIRVEATNGGISLIVIVRVRQTLACTKDSSGKLVLGKRATD